MDAREVIKEADSLRSKARHAREAYKLADPAVGLGLRIGTFTLWPELVRALRQTMFDEAVALEGQAERLEAKLVVVDA